MVPHAKSSQKRRAKDCVLGATLCDSTVQSNWYGGVFLSAEEFVKYYESSLPNS